MNGENGRERQETAEEELWMAHVSSAEVEKMHICSVKLEERPSRFDVRIRGERGVMEKRM